MKTSFTTSCKQSQEKIEKLYSDKNLTQFLSNSCFIMDEIVLSPQKKVSNLKYSGKRNLIVDNLNVVEYVDDLLKCVYN
jgi:hypothetical protein